MAGKRDYLTYQDLVRQIEKGQITPVYLFQGQEDFLIEECLERLKQKVVPDEAADFNCDKFAGKQLDARDVVDLAQTLPFLSPWRFIAITEAHELSKAAQQQITAYLEKPSATTCLALTTPKLDSRTKFAQALKRSATVVQFWKLFDRDVPPWIQRRARQAGYTMSAGTAAYLAEFVGNDLRQLDNELQKVIAYTESQEITSEVVQRVVGDIRERDIFELVEAIGSGSVLDALRILNQLLIEGEPALKILAMVTRQLRLLWKVKVFLSERRSLSSRELAGKIGVPARSADALVRQVQRFSQKQLKQGLKQISAVDTALKSSTNSPQMLLEELFIDLCV